MKLTAVFEHWHLGDGNYPAFEIGDEGRLSFELDLDHAEPAPPDAPEAFEHLRDADYVATARVIRRYRLGNDSMFPVFQAGTFRFYSPSAEAAGLAPGSLVRLRGTLALDHYQWVEFLDRYPDPPDLFYNLRVVRIRRVAIPERFVRRSERGVAHPTVVGPEHYGADSYEEVRRVAAPEGGPAFSLIDFEALPAGAGPDRPTFIGA